MDLQARQETPPPPISTRLEDAERPSPSSRFSPMFIFVGSVLGPLAKTLGPPCSDGPAPSHVTP